MNKDSMGVEQLTFNTDHDSQRVFSADGGWIAYVSYRDGNQETYMRTYGSILHIEYRLTNNAADDRRPAWSPDGKKIAFDSYRGVADAEIYTMKAMPEGRKNRPKNLTNNAFSVDDYQPDWQPVP